MTLTALDPKTANELVQLCTALGGGWVGSPGFERGTYTTSGPLTTQTDTAILSRILSLTN